MKRALAIAAILALAVGLVGLLGSDAVTVGVGQRSVERAETPARANFVEVKWPFLRDQWGDGRAFRCAPADCGVEVKVYLRPKIGFCNCDTGVEDDAELDRVGDLELFSDKFIALGNGHEIRVGWMAGRSRPYRVDLPYGQPLTAQAMAFNEKCDVMVATVVTPLERLPDAARLALEFLNGDMIIKWAKAEFGV
jgi:hypothetical protein